RKISCCYTIHIYKNFTNSPVFPGNYQLIFPFEPILAAPGDDVILPCRVDPYWNAMEKTVEWSRPDLKASDPQKRVEYVYVHRFRKMDRDMMMETYIQRTSLSEGLRHGDVSLRIHNVSLEDNGRFRCFIPSLSREDEETGMEQKTQRSSGSSSGSVQPQEELEQRVHGSLFLGGKPELISPSCLMESAWSTN
uniref:Ig-like domain-containing protein n=1 Tax=Cyprinodon variegatus TaxID=28743 RepID=A0A3Q2GC99_CYPVA